MTAPVGVYIRRYSYSVPTPSLMPRLDDPCDHFVMILQGLL